MYNNIVTTKCYYMLYVVINYYMLAQCIKSYVSKVMLNGMLN